MAADPPHCTDQAGPAGVRVKVGTRAENGSLVLTVRDDGLGIAPELMERIFEPYFTTRRAQCATGLGLSLVHGIVRDHGATIRVTSPSAGGTLVRVEFPVPKPPASAD